MTKSNQELKPPVGLVTGVLAGTAAAILYTMSNIALRHSVQINPFLVSAVKAAPTVICLSPFLVWMMARGQPIYTSLQMAPRFMAVALLGQFVGNAAFQWALGSIGLAASVPITLGTLLIGGAVLGRVILGEPVRPRSMIAMALLIVAVVVLSLAGENDANDPAVNADISATQSETDSPIVVPPWIGAICAGSSGLAYALFGTVMRQAMSHGLSPALTMWISGMVGTLSLWLVTWWTVDASAWAALSESEWKTMGIAGIFNFTAFVALSLALKALPVVAVNLINASQVAMAAIAGIVLFEEEPTLSLIVGIALTFIGLSVLASRRKQRSTIAMEDGVALVNPTDNSTEQEF